MKKVITWTATYTTEIEVPDNATPEQIGDAAAEIDIDVPGSIYQEDSWDVEKVD